MKEKTFLVMNESKNLKLAEFYSSEEAIEFATLKWKENKKDSIVVMDESQRTVISRVGILLG